MTIKFWDRFFSAIAGLIILFLGICLLILTLGIFPFQLDQTIQGFLKGDIVLWLRVVVIGIAVVFVLLGIHDLSLLFRRTKDRGFIMQHTELGDMSISVHAMENMVKKCVDTHEDLKVIHTRIHRTKDGISVGIRISLANGVNIPLTVNNLQKQIKHYITSISGVDVKEVRVMVETGNQLPKSAEVIAPDLLAADTYATNTPSKEPTKEPMHQRIFKQKEAEQLVPQPPASVPGEPVDADESAASLTDEPTAADNPPTLDVQEREVEISAEDELDVRTKENE